MANYEDLGVKRIINAAGTYTKFGGSLIPSEIIEAMEDASHSFVDIDELLQKSGEYIARCLNVEAALVTAGAAAGLTLSAAACIAGSEPKCIKALPNSEGMKNEFIIMRCHRNPYDQALIMAGAKLIEVGNAIETHLYEVEGAINEKTVGIVFFIQSEMLEASLSLKEIITIAQDKNIKVIVDAAGELPPIENLVKFVKMGADIVLFSGGKDIRGPQSSGLMVGKKDIVEICRLHGYPHHAIGRPMKLDKETIMGLVRAIELYLKEDHQQRIKKWEEQVEYLKKGLDNIPYIQVFSGYPTQPLTQPATIPRVYVKFNEKTLGMTKEDIAQKLYEGNPRIATVVEKNYLTLNPHMLASGEEKLVLEKIKEIIKKN
ncbi:MAG: aminotransferase class V-fold PLP-dependent enzyme [Candidatus Atribacteria bacterium]|nr:aminotransferase class V-fold PLP-dependent enzyme [Candidatus Atribacteria bacterium]